MSAETPAPSAAEVEALAEVLHRFGWYSRIDVAPDSLDRIVEAVLAAGYRKVVEQ